MKYFAYTVVGFVCIVLLNCREKSEKPASKSKDLPKYSEVLQSIEEKRLELATRYRQSQTNPQRAEVVGEAREVLFNAIRDDLLPQWSGTPWDFNGTTEIPGEGKIACGYFVTTILRDAGFKVQRAKMVNFGSSFRKKPKICFKNVHNAQIFRSFSM
jgi:hypothetical protein